MIDVVSPWIWLIRDRNMLKAKCFKHLTVSLNICAFCVGYYLYICLSVSNRLVTVLRAELSGVWIHAGTKVLCPLQNVQTGCWGLPSLLFSGYRGSFPWGQAAGSSSCPLTFSAVVKNEWSYSSTPRVCLHGAEGDRDPFLPLFSKYALV